MIENELSFFNDELVPLYREDFLRFRYNPQQGGYDVVSSRNLFGLAIITLPQSSIALERRYSAALKKCVSFIMLLRGNSLG